MKEKVIIIFIALIIGLFVTTIGFYLYQSTKTISEKVEVKKTPTPIAEISPIQQQSKNFILIDEPNDEAVTNTRTIQVKGKTNPENTIVISSNSDESIGTASTDGSFSMSVTIDAGTNDLTIRAISPNGEEVKDERTISFSTEDF